MDTTPRHMPDTAFPFLAELSRRMDGRSAAPTAVRDAVAVLTTVADPQRAARLRPGPAEPPVLVQRLAVWALRQVDDDAVALAWQVLEGLDPSVTAAPAALEPVAC